MLRVGDRLLVLIVFLAFPLFRTALRCCLGTRCWNPTTLEVPERCSNQRQRKHCGRANDKYVVLLPLLHFLSVASGASVECYFTYKLEPQRPQNRIWAAYAVPHWPHNRSA